MSIKPNNTVSKSELLECLKVVLYDYKNLYSLAKELSCCGDEFDTFNNSIGFKETEKLIENTIRKA